MKLAFSKIINHLTCVWVQTFKIAIEQKDLGEINSKGLVSICLFFFSSLFAGTWNENKVGELSKHSHLGMLLLKIDGAFYLLIFKIIAQCLGVHSCIFTRSSQYSSTAEHSPGNKVLINNLSSLLISPVGRHFFCNDFLIHKKHTHRSMGGKILFQWFFN